VVGRPVGELPFINGFGAVGFCGLPTGLTTGLLEREGSAGGLLGLEGD